MSDSPLSRAEDAVNQQPTGTCQACCRTIALEGTGRVRRHTRPGGKCPGSLHMPALDTSGADVTPVPIADTDGLVHEFFGLTYSSYQVVPRVLAQSMPHDWQARFVACMEELEAAFAHIETPSNYDVRPAEVEYACDLTGAQRAATGVICEWNDERDELVCHDRNGNEIDKWTRILVPIPDPLPPYNRGRTRVLRADQIAADDPHSCDNCSGIDPDTCLFNGEKES